MRYVMKYIATMYPDFVADYWEAQRMMRLAQHVPTNYNSLDIDKCVLPNEPFLHLTYVEVSPQISLILH